MNNISYLWLSIVLPLFYLKYVNFMEADMKIERADTG